MEKHQAVIAVCIPRDSKMHLCKHIHHYFYADIKGAEEISFSFFFRATCG